jgi:hypothetical protein
MNKLLAVSRSNHRQVGALSLASGLVAVMLWFCSAWSGAGGTNLNWRWSNPAPHGNNIQDLVYLPTNGVTLQVCEFGQAYYSYDNYNWSTITSGVTNALRSVAAYGSRVVVGCENGKLLWVDWPGTFHTATLDTDTTDWFEGVDAGVVQGNPLYVAVGDNGAIYTSATGTNWIKRNSGTTQWLRSVTFGLRMGQSVIVAVGENGTILVSTDGISWTRATSSTSQHLNRVTMLNGNFFACGENGAALISMTGGNTWQVESSGAANALYFEVMPVNGSRLVGGVEEVRGYEQLTWYNFLDTTRVSRPPSWTYTSAITQTGYALLAGRSGMLVEAYRTNANYYWTEQYKSVRNWLWDVRAVDGLYVTVGDYGTILTSANGVDWSQEGVPTDVSTNILLGVGGDTNQLIVVGEKGIILHSTNTVLTVVSTNQPPTTNIINQLGVIWTAVAARPTTNVLQGVAKGASITIAVGDNGTIVTSTNGLRWAVRPSATLNDLTGAAAFPGGFVATGSKGTILTSPDGMTWTARTQATTNWIYRVRHVNGVLVAVGQNGLLMTSTNGVAWTSRNSGTTAWLTDIAGAGNAWYAVGTLGVVLTSTNLVNWSSVSIMTAKSLYGAALKDGQLVVVGIEGIILRSQAEPFVTPVNFLGYQRTFNSTNVYHVYLFGGKVDQSFTLDYAPHLTGSWTAGPTMEISDGSGVLYYLETDSLTNATPLELHRTRSP